VLWAPNTIERFIRQLSERRARDVRNEGSNNAVFQKVRKGHFLHPAKHACDPTLLLADLHRLPVEIGGQDAAHRVSKYADRPRFLRKIFRKPVTEVSANKASFSADWLFFETFLLRLKIHDPEDFRRTIERLHIVAERSPSGLWDVYEAHWPLKDTHSLYGGRRNAGASARRTIPDNSLYGNDVGKSFRHETNLNLKVRGQMPISDLQRQPRLAVQRRLSFDLPQFA